MAVGITFLATVFASTIVAHSTVMAAPHGHISTCVDEQGNVRDGDSEYCLRKQREAVRRDNDDYWNDDGWN